MSHPSLNALGAGGGPTGFIAAFDPTKSGAASLVYSTFLGGRKYNTSDAVRSIAADADGNVYATGTTNSADFSTTPGAYATTACTDPTATHCGTIFATKLDPSGSKLVYSTVITDGADDSYQIAIDSARNAYLLSRGHSANFRFIDPVSRTGGVSIQTLSADGSKLLFSTLFSSEVNGAQNNGFVVDKSGNIYVASTNVNADLAVTTGAFQTTPGLDTSGRPTSDGYVVKISPIGASVSSPPDGGVDGGGGTAGEASGLGDAGASVGGTNGVGGAEAGSSGLRGIAANDAGGASAEAGAAGDNPAGAGRVVRRSGGDCSCGVAANDARGPGLAVMGLLVTLSRRRRWLRRSRTMQVARTRTGTRGRGV